MKNNEKQLEILIEHYIKGIKSNNNVKQSTEQLNHFAAEYKALTGRCYKSNSVYDRQILYVGEK